MTTLDLFAGAGGLTEGFRQADRRFRVERAVEWDLAAAATFEANHGRGVAYHGGIEDWLNEEAVPQVDVVLGGPPCQGFSALGRQDLSDERNSLWRKYAQTILLAQPKYFVMENVPQFLGSPELAMFEEATRTGFLQDYTFETRILNAADHGAPQVRKRGIVIGRRRDMHAPIWPLATRSREDWRTVRWAWRGLPQEVRDSGLPHPDLHPFAGTELPGPFRGRDLHITRQYTDLSLRRFAHIKRGGNRHDLPDELSAPCWRRHTSGASDVMGRLHWDRPSVTIRTEFFKPEKGRYLHPEEHRAITHLEAARIQGFPDKYKWVGTKTAIARQIGNAVPIALASALARSIAAALDPSLTIPVVRTQDEPVSSSGFLPLAFHGDGSVASTEMNSARA
ncbi:cytosine-specific methyltransferase [Phycicoccus sp. DTK01]|nr:cytosine-specific methyltransferase [Phycicoccus sp. DTK01]